MKSFTNLLASGLFLLSFAEAQADPYANDPLSYGGSPAVLPGPIGTGSGGARWSNAYAQARSLVAQMTNQEKNNLTYGHTDPSNGCSGVSGGAPRVGFPGLCLQDAGNGVRGTDGVNAYAAGLHVGASWNRRLARRRAVNMGREFKGKGVHAVLGPVAGPLGRIALGGRNWEGFSNDPYLAGQLTSETITGLQQSVIATIKHFIGNEQETNRIPNFVNQSSTSSNIDDKTIHELYMWPFQDAINAGTMSVMASYNRVNNSFVTQNSKALNGLLKTELGFQGYVVSDWGGQRTGIASANAGLDMAMPNSAGCWDNNTLVTAVANGTVTQARLDDMATRIVAAWYFINANSSDYPALGSGMPASLLVPHKYTNVKDPASKPNLLAQAEEGHVLVKNTNGALPFKSPQLISLFGYDAVVADTRDPDGAGLGNFALSADSITFVNGTANSWFSAFLNGSGVLPPAAYNGTIISGGGSGASTPAYISAPYDAFQQEAYARDFQILWNFHSEDPLVDQASDACLVFINAFANEGTDRPALEDDFSDNLVNNVASKCNNTMVILHNAGIRTVDAWIENPNVTAVIYAHLPGQNSGRALTNLMFGDRSFSGRMPYTVAKQPADYGALLNPVGAGPAGSLEYYYPQDNFSEGVYIDYRAFIARDIQPRFEFGYGLTYSTYNYSNLQVVTRNNNTLAYLPPNSAQASTSAPIQGGLPSLWTNIATVTFTLRNTGAVTAMEVPQLYIGIPGGPAKQLRGFDKINLKANQTKSVTIHLTRRDLSTWSVVEQQWVLQSGSYGVYVGASVLDVRLHGVLAI